MCGISGCINLNANIEEISNLNNKIVNGQYNRGPDYSHVSKLSEHITFGHNRLSIIDVSSNSHQPFFDHTKRYCLTFNGEIFNYIEIREELKSLGINFRTTGDCEVLLEAFKQWGTDSFVKFNGMFAFAIYDTQTSQLWLCRDRFGIKPCFYSFSSNSFYFASQGKELAQYLKLPVNLNYLAKGIQFYLYEGSEGISQYENLSALQPGHYIKLTIKNHKISLQTKQYYNLEERILISQNKLKNITLNNALEELDFIIQNSVDLRLRSDVPLAISISGGVDSSTIAYYVSKRKHDLVAYNFGSPTLKSSEGPIVEELSKKLNIAVKYINPSSDEFTNYFWKCLKSQDAPFSSCSIVAQYAVFKKMKEDGFKVALGGQGGDESLLGYKKFQLFYLLDLFRNNNFFTASKFAIEMTPLMLAESLNFFKLFHQIQRYFSGGVKKSNLLNLPSHDNMNLGLNQQSLLKRNVQDITDFSLPTLLRYEDRNSMGNSIESRLPFMDYRFIEFAQGLPNKYKLKNGYGKWILRKLMDKKIPDSIIWERHKRGFDTKDSYWIENGLGNSIRNNLVENGTNISDITNQNFNIINNLSDKKIISQNLFPTLSTLAWKTLSNK